MYHLNIGVKLTVDEKCLILSIRLPAGYNLGFTRDSGIKNLPAMQKSQETWFSPCIGKIPWKRAWQGTSAFLPGDLHGQRSLVGYSPWGTKSQT